MGKSVEIADPIAFDRDEYRRRGCGPKCIGAGFLAGLLVLIVLSLPFWPAQKQIYPGRGTFTLSLFKALSGNSDWVVAPGVAYLALRATMIGAEETSINYQEMSDALGASDDDRNRCVAGGDSSDCFPASIGVWLTMDPNRQFKKNIGELGMGLGKARIKATQLNNGREGMKELVQWATDGVSLDLAGKFETDKLIPKEGTMHIVTALEVDAKLPAGIEKIGNRDFNGAAVPFIGGKVRGHYLLRKELKAEVIRLPLTDENMFLAVLLPFADSSPEELVAKMVDLSAPEPNACTFEASSLAGLWKVDVDKDGSDADFDVKVVDLAMPQLDLREWKDLSGPIQKRSPDGPGIGHAFGMPFKDLFARISDKEVSISSFVHGASLRTSVSPSSEKQAPEGEFVTVTVDRPFLAFVLSKPLVNGGEGTKPAEGICAGYLDFVTAAMVSNMKSEEVKN